MLCVLISRGQRFNHALCLSMCSTECLKQPSSAKPTNAVSGRFCFVVSCAPVTFRHAAERLDAASSPCDAAVMQSTCCCLLCVFLMKVIMRLWSFHLSHLPYVTEISVHISWECVQRNDTYWSGIAHVAYIKAPSAESDDQTCKYMFSIFKTWT